MNAVLAIGNVILDRVCTVHEPVVPGAKLVHACQTQFAGGQAANVARTLAGLGMPVAFAGAFGDDMAGTYLQDVLTRQKIDLSPAVVIKDCPSASAMVAVHKASGERTILVHKPHRLRIAARHFTTPAFKQALATADALYLDGHEMIHPAFLKEARRQGKALFFDLEIIPANIRAILHAATCLMASAAALQTLTQARRLAHAFEALAPYRIPIVVATDGSRGAVACFQNRLLKQAASSTHAVDTTGAGDAFRAGFLWSHAAGRPVPECLRIASELASWKCACRGPAIPASKLRKFSKYPNHACSATPVPDRQPVEGILL